ncbi:MAG: hypothetical protein HQL13_00535 [Candidatus Omnitrophica bacterium]|nr:hypothetical protein [Candidatus Omnitrophota bacterium]
MPNITLSIPQQLLKEGRDYAKKNNTTLNALVRDLLSHVSWKSKEGCMKDFFALADRHPVSSKGKKWKREDLYDI